MTKLGTVDWRFIVGAAKVFVARQAMAARPKLTLPSISGDVVNLHGSLRWV